VLIQFNIYFFLDMYIVRREMFVKSYMIFNLAR